MARRDDAKEAALAASRTLNSDPQKVTDPAFAAGGFFDPADLLQVKYEMVRQVEVEGVPVSAAAGAFGFARQSVYNARAALAAGGLAALIPGKPGPKGGHKLTGPVLDHLQALLEQDPRLTFGELAAQAAQRFGIQVHPRSVRRALERRLTDPGAETAGLAAPKSGRRGWPPGEWHPGWPRGPPPPPIPALATTRQQRCRRPARPCPPPTPSRPAPARTEVMPARRPARRCRSPRR